MNTRLLALFISLSLCIVSGDRFKTVHRQARARHILVSKRLECEDLKKKIDEGADFELIWLKPIVFVQVEKEEAT